MPEFLAFNSMYKIFRGLETGKFVAVNRTSDGAFIPIEDESHSLTIELREWESTHGQLDLSDRPPTPTPPPSDWEAFYTSFESSPIDLKIQSSSDRVAVLRLSIEFGKRPNLSLERLKIYWNRAIGGLSSPLNKDEIQVLRDWISTTNLPIEIISSGLIV